VETPNLDAMDQQELIAFNDNENNDSRLREYAALRWRAVMCRLQGRIATALQWESAMDHLYKQLPSELKW
jgi:hypothetical protein